MPIFLDLTKSEERDTEKGVFVIPGGGGAKAKGPPFMLK